MITRPCCTNHVILENYKVSEIVVEPPTPICKFIWVSLIYIVLVAGIVSFGMFSPLFGRYQGFFYAGAAGIVVIGVVHVVTLFFTNVKHYVLVPHEASKQLL